MQVIKRREYPSVEEHLWNQFDLMGTFGKEGRSTIPLFADALPNDFCVILAWAFGISPDKVDEEYELFLNWVDNEA